MSEVKTNLERDLYNKVQKKKGEIAKAEAGVYQTDCMFAFSKTGPRTDIRTVRSESDLVEILAFLNTRDMAHKKAVETLGVNVKNTWLGADISNWENDLKVRATALNIAQERAKLQSMEDTLKRISPELLKEIELESIAAQLS